MQQSTYAITDSQLYQEAFSLFDGGSERALLAILIKHPDLMQDAHQTVPDAWFNLPLNRYIYQAMKYQFENAVRYGWPVSFTAQSLLAIARWCGPVFEKNLVEKTNGLAAIRDLEFLAKENAHIADYPTLRQVLKDRATRVAYYYHSRKMMTRALDVSGVPDIYNLHVENDTFTSSLLADDIDDVEHKMTRLGDADPGLQLKMRLGAQYPGIDLLGTRVNHMPFLMAKLAYGWRAGGLSVIAARPKVGKSTLLLWMAVTAAIEQNLPILYLDSEMSREEMYSRAMSRLSGRLEQDILLGKCFDGSGVAEKAVIDAVDLLKQANFIYMNVAGMHYSRIPAILRQFRTQYVGTRTIRDKWTGIDHTFSNQALVLYDWLKLSSADDLKSAQEHQQLGFMCSALKDAAKANNLPIVAGAQNNREAIQKKDGPPTDFEESGEAMVAGSDRIAQFCTALFGLRNVTPKEAEAIEGAFPLRSHDEHDHPHHKLFYNQMLHLYLQRGGSDWKKGVPLYLNRGQAAYEEMVKDPNGLDLKTLEFIFKFKKSQKQQAAGKAPLVIEKPPIPPTSSTPV